MDQGSVWFELELDEVASSDDGESLQRKSSDDEKRQRKDEKRVLVDLLREKDHRIMMLKRRLDQADRQQTSMQDTIDVSSFAVRKLRFKVMEAQREKSDNDNDVDDISSPEEIVNAAIHLVDELKDQNKSGEGSGVTEGVVLNKTYDCYDGYCDDFIRTDLRQLETEITAREEAFLGLSPKQKRNGKVVSLRMGQLYEERDRLHALLCRSLKRTANPLLSPRSRELFTIEEGRDDLELTGIVRPTERVLLGLQEKARDIEFEGSFIFTTNTRRETDKHRFLKKLETFRRDTKRISIMLHSQMSASKTKVESAEQQLKKVKSLNSELQRTLENNAINHQIKREQEDFNDNLTQKLGRIQTHSFTDKTRAELNKSQSELGIIGSALGRETELLRKTKSQDTVDACIAEITRELKKSSESGKTKESIEGIENFVRRVVEIEKRSSAELLKETLHQLMKKSSDYDELLQKDASKRHQIAMLETNTKRQDEEKTVNEERQKHLKDDIASLEQELATTKQQLDQKTKQTLDTLDSYGSVMMQMEKKITYLQTENAKLKEDVMKLKAMKLKLERKVACAKQDFKGELDSCNSQLEEKSLRVNELKAKQAELQKDFDRVVNELNYFHQRVKELQLQLTVRDEQKSKLESLVDGFFGHATGPMRQETNSVPNRDVRMMAEKEDGDTGINDSFAKKMFTFIKAAKEQQQLLANAQREQSNSEQATATMVERLESETSSQRQQIKELRGALEGKNQQVEGHKSDLEARLQATGEELALLRRERDQSEETCTEYERVVTELKEERFILEDNLSFAERQVDTLNNSLETANRQAKYLEAEVKELSKQNKNLHGQTEELRRAKDIIEKHLEKMKQERREISQEHEELKLIKGDIGQRDRTIISLQNRIEMESGRLAQAQRTVQSMEEELSEAIEEREEVKLLCDELSALRTFMGELEREELEGQNATCSESRGREMEHSRIESTYSSISESDVNGEDVGPLSRHNLNDKFFASHEEIIARLKESHKNVNEIVGRVKQMHWSYKNQAITINENRKGAQQRAEEISQLKAELKSHLVEMEKLKDDDNLERKAVTEVQIKELEEKRKEVADLTALLNQQRKSIEANKKVAQELQELIARYERSEDVLSAEMKACHSRHNTLMLQKEHELYNFEKRMRESETEWTNVSIQYEESKAKLTSDMEMLLRDLDLARKETVEKCAQIDELNQIVDAANQNLSGLREELQMREIEKCELNEKHCCLSETNREAENKLQDLHDQYEALQKDNNSLVSFNEELRRNLRDIGNELACSVQRLVDNEGIFEGLKEFHLQEEEGMKEMFACLQRNLQKLSSDLQHEKNEKAKLVDQIQEDAATLETVRSEKKQLQEENKMLLTKAELNEKTCQDLRREIDVHKHNWIKKEKLKSLKQRMQILEETNLVIQEKLRRVENENALRKSSNIEKQANEMEALRLENESFQTKLGEASVCCVQLQAQLQTKGKLLSRAEETVKQLRNQLTHNETILSAKTKEYERVKTTNEDLKSTTKARDKALDTYIVKLDKMSEENKNLQTIAKRDKKSQTLALEKQYLLGKEEGRAEVEVYVKQAERLSEELDIIQERLHQHKESEKKGVAMMREALQTQKSTQVQELKRTIAALRAERKELKATMDECRITINELETARSHWRRDVDKKSEENSVLRREKIVLETEVQWLRSAIQSAKLKTSNVNVVA